jgi:hypothetical protein
MVSDLGMDDLVNELAAALDQQADLLETRRSQLLALREAILRYDNDALERMLEQVERTIQDQAPCDARLRQASERAAAAAGCAGTEVRLSLLIERLPQRYRAMLEARRTQLVGLTHSLRRKHLETALLLRECARVNRELLDRLLPGGGVTVYGSGGRNHWRGDTGSFNMEF